jgi:L-lactate dehydrogenase (cytochrome)
MSRALSKCHNIEDVRRIACRRLPLPLRDLLEGGAEDESTLSRNTSAFDDIRLRPRVLVDVSDIDLTTEVLGQRLSMPLMFSPTGASGSWHPDAEIAVARSAGEAGIFYSLSTASTKSLEEVALASSGPKLFQLYAFKDHDVNRELIRRSRQAGYNALCVTVDTAVGPGNRERDTRNGMSPGTTYSLKSILSVLSHPRWGINMLRHGGSRLEMVESMMPPGRHSLQDVRRFLGQTMTSSMTWMDAERIAADWGGKFAIKGIMTAEDARRAVDCGATAIIISNHGGRQLDGVAAPIEVLPWIVDAVGTRAELIVDGGIRRGTHIIKALGLGAKAVMTGRPYIYGLAAGGKPGVDRVVEIIRRELTLNMGLLGASSVTQLDSGYVQAVEQACFRPAEISPRPRRME